METEASQPIIIAFDGECLMCSRTIRWVADRDAENRIRFTRLQDPTGAEMITQSGEAPLDSMLVRQNDQTLARSSAVLAVLETIGGFWKIPATLGKWIPRPVRDKLYDYVASHRYQWFGKGDACALPSEALRKRLLP
ncbi:thiol-disulfide oxidoreductase DCC family protein [Haloferula sp.]|uniref:thiol-disulfide oxidoreductase DCC family protein n=1 Tax=Haloferula sp. TaxID=2497595 RepID=UPI00329FE2F1